MAMKKWSVDAVAYATKHLGEVEAETKEEAERLAYEEFGDKAWIRENVSNDFEVSDTEIEVEEY